MGLQIHLHSIRCLNESDEISGSDEVYVLATVAGLRPPISGVPIPAIPNFQVSSFGIFEDMDDDEGAHVVDGRPFWGMDGNPADIRDPSDVGIVISLMEQDNGTPAQYVELANIKTGLSLGKSLGDPSPRSRATRLTNDISNVFDAIDVPIPFNFDDDHIGTQQLVLDTSDLITGGHKDKTMIIAGDDAEYELIFRVRFRGWEHSVPSLGQELVAAGTSPTSWVSAIDKIQHLAYVGRDGLVHESFFRLVGGPGHWEHNIPSLGQALVAPNASPTSWVTPDDVQHVAYVGNDGLVHESFFRLVGGPGHWQHNIPNLGQVLVAPNTSPTSWVTMPEKIQHVAYVGIDGLVHESFFRLDGGPGHWEQNTPNLGQVLVAPNTSPTSWVTPDQAQHLAYVGTDGLIHESFFRIGGPGHWEQNTPTLGFEPTRDGTSPTSWFTPPKSVQHIGYVGRDGQLHQVFFFIGGFGGWQHEVTGSLPVPVAPNSSPTSWFTAPESIQHLAYAGTDGLIHESFFVVKEDASHEWLHSVPGAGRQPVAAGSSPTSWFTPTENIQHIAYVGTDGVIHEVFFRI